MNEKKDSGPARMTEKNIKVSIIIPAYNEGPRIGAVLDALETLPENWEIIVVSDGSRDDTVSIVKGFGCVTIIDLPKNVGKAAAMYTGYQKSQGEYVMFVDADLVGLKSHHLGELLKPILENKADMSLATLRTSDNVQVTLSHICFPHLSGQRAARREIWQKIFDTIPDIKSLRYGIEIAAKKISSGMHWKIKIIKWRGVSQVTKEQKEGLKKGLKSRAKMYKEMLGK